MSGVKSVAEQATRHHRAAGANRRRHRQLASVTAAPAIGSAGGKKPLWPGFGAGLRTQTVCEYEIPRRHRRRCCSPLQYN